jgi:hypothetical protein
MRFKGKSSMTAKKKLFRAAAVTTLLCLASLPVGAATFDGTKNAICAVIEVIACAEGANCRRGPARNFELPELVVIDVAEKVVRGTHHSGIEETSHVNNMEMTGSRLVLQGVENGHGWGISIDSESGTMSASVVGDMADFILFGACAPI